MRTERTSVSTTSTGRRRRRSAPAFGEPRRKEHILEIPLEAPLDAGAQNLPAPRPRPRHPPVRTLAQSARSRRRRPAGRNPRTAFRSWRPRRPRRWRARFRGSPARPGALPRFELEHDFRADDIGRELAELDVGGAEAVDRPRKAHRVAPGDQIGRAEAEAGERRWSRPAKAPSRARTKTGARDLQGVADLVRTSLLHPNEWRPRRR